MHKAVEYTPAQIINALAGCIVAEETETVTESRGIKTFIRRIFR